MKRTISVALALVLILMLSACGFWSENQLEVVKSFEEEPVNRELDVILNEDYAELGITNIKYIYVAIEEQKIYVQRYFKEYFGQDVSKKLDKIKDIYLFQSGNQYEPKGFVANNAIYLNQELLRNQDELYSSLLNQIIHWIGVRAPKDNSYYTLVEGFDEALSQEVAYSYGRTYVKNNSYELAARLAKQMICADKSIVKKFLSDSKFNIGDYINKILKKVPRNHGTCNNPAQLLENCLIADVYNTETSDNEKLGVKLQAQYIAISFCKRFKLDRKQKQEIEDTYLLINFEEK